MFFSHCAEFNQIKDESGDSFYVRAGFDRPGILNTDDLPFIKDEILYVSLNFTFCSWQQWFRQRMLLFILGGHDHIPRCVRPVAGMETGQVWSSSELRHHSQSNEVS